jgi:transposase
MNLRSREAPPTMAVPMLDSEIVRQIRALSALGWGAKRISDAVGASRNAVRRYLRLGAAADVQVRPQARQLDAEQRALAVELLEGEAAGNAVVVQRLLHERGVEATVRTVQRAVETRRQERRAAELATVRYETAPGHQMQIDFGERRISIGGVLVRVFLFVAVLATRDASSCGPRWASARTIGARGSPARSAASEVCRKRYSSTAPARWSSATTPPAGPRASTPRSLRSVRTGASTCVPADRIGPARRARSSRASAT